MTKVAFLLVVARKNASSEFLKKNHSCTFYIFLFFLFAIGLRYNIDVHGGKCYKRKTKQYQ